MKKYILIFSAVFLLMPFLAAAQNADTANGVTLEDLEITDPGVLPTSPFYFLKEWGRGFQRVFTFNPVSRAELELKIANEKAAELKEVSEKEPQNVEALERAVANYKESAERLKLRFGVLQETSANPNVDELLNKLADRVIKHEQLFDELKAKHEAARETIEAAREDLEEAAADAAERLDTAEKLKERFKKAVEKQRERETKELRAVGVLDRLEVKIKDDEVRIKLSEVKDDLVREFDEKVRERLISPSAVDALIQNLPITEANRLRILEQIKERTESSEVKIRLENIEGRIRTEVKEEVGGRKEEAERMIKAASELIGDLRERINSGKYGSIPESVKSLLSRAENHMVNAKAAFEKGDYGEAFGQASSAAVAAKSAIDQLLRANAPSLAPSVKPLPLPVPTTVSPEKPQVCTKEYNPVCGVNGKTYGNECEARVAGVAVKLKGECPAAVTPPPTTVAPTETETAPTTVRVAQKWTVEIKDGQFSPAELKIKSGDTVVWLNRGAAPAWPASAIHPTHLLYPGFDALRGINAGESYSFTFDKAGSWKYHNHLSPSFTGAVVVE